jgi:hypothetical protein
MNSQYRQGRSDHRSGKIRARNIWRVVLDPLRLPYYLGIVSSLLSLWTTRVSWKVSVPFVYLRLLLPSGSSRIIADTSLIILTSNVLSRRTQFCLRSVLKYEIPQEIVILQTNKEFNYSSGVNRGIRASTTNNIILLNDDCFVKDKWLSSLLRLAESEPRAGIVGSKLLHPNGHIFDTGSYISLNDGKPVPVMSQPETAHPVKGYLACGLLIKRKTITDIGLFDEAYSPFLYEDADFCYRARSKGWQVYYCPESQVYHILGATVGKLNQAYVKSVLERNKQLFLERWRDLMKKDAV